MVGRDIDLIFALFGINEEIETAICILHFRKEVCFPFHFLHNVAFPVPTFRQSKIVQLGNSRKHIGGEHQLMNESGAIDGVFAIIARIVMSP